MRKRPISLEIKPELPDDRVVLDREKAKPEAQELDLEDSIDKLLEEVDATCASVENPKAGKKDPNSIESLNAVAPPTPAEPTDTAQAVPAEVEAGEESADGGEAAVEPVADARDVEDDTLAALDRVEEKAQTLLEDSIDQLLKQAAETGSGASNETESPEASAAPTASVAEVAEDAAGVIDVDAIDAQLDALETGGPADAAAHEIEIPEAAHADALVEPTQALETEAPADAVEPDSPEELLDQIADDLTGSTPNPEHEETAPDHAAAPVVDATEALDGGDVAASDEAETPDASSAEDISAALADLDASIADASMELMGDFETPEGELISSDSLADANDASALLEQLGLDELPIETSVPREQSESKPREDTEAAKPQPHRAAAVPEGTKQDPAVAAPAVAAPAVAVASSHKPLRPKAVEQAPVFAEPEGEVESIWQVAQRRIVTHSKQAMELARVHAGPVAARAVFVINKPVKEKPAQLRDSIGYLALWTLLLAMILWVYLVFIRVTPTPTPTQAPSRMLEPGEIVDPLRSNDGKP